MNLKCLINSINACVAPRRARCAAIFNLVTQLVPVLSIVPVLVPVLVPVPTSRRCVPNSRTYYRLFPYKRGFTRDYNTTLQKRLGVTAELRLLRGAVGPCCMLTRSVTLNDFTTHSYVIVGQTSRPVRMPRCVSPWAVEPIRRRLA